jgi:hypothetical protein
MSSIDALIVLPLFKPPSTALTQLVTIVCSITIKCRNLGDTEQGALCVEMQLNLTLAETPTYQFFTLQITEPLFQALENGQDPATVTLPTLNSTQCAELSYCKVPETYTLLYGTSQSLDGVAGAKKVFDNVVLGACPNLKSSNVVLCTASDSPYASSSASIPVAANSGSGSGASNGISVVGMGVIGFLAHRQENLKLFWQSKTVKNKGFHLLIPLVEFSLKIEIPTLLPSLLWCSVTFRIPTPRN